LSGPDNRANYQNRRIGSIRTVTNENPEALTGSADPGHRSQVEKPAVHDPEHLYSDMDQVTK